MVKYERPPFATSRARSMRREMTDAERKLWFLLRSRRLEDAKFRRQVPIGPFIADFVCLGRKLIFEADGGQHFQSDHDIERDRWLSREGYVVVRYANNDILGNPEGVLTDLAAKLTAPPHPVSARSASLDHPLPRRGEGKRSVRES
jgi:very-short-patch-repair endonuclease